ncbi:methylenetetrahydrofolate reductase [Phormidesmis sp. 146-33]
MFPFSPCPSSDVSDDFSLETLLTTNRFVFSAELMLLHPHAASLMKAANRAAQHVNIVQMSDRLLPQPRLSSSVATQYIQQLGLDSIVELSLQKSDLYDQLFWLANAQIRNVLVSDGFPDHHGSDRAVRTIAAIARFRSEATFYVGAVEVPCLMPDIAESMARLTAKIDSGAQFIQVRSLLNLEAMEQWMAAVRSRQLHQRAHFIVSILPFNSLEQLRFLQSGRNHAFIGMEFGQPESNLQRLQNLIVNTSAIEGVCGIHLRLNDLGMGWNHHR